MAALFAAALLVALLPRGAAGAAEVGGADFDVRSCFDTTDSTECLQRGFDAAATTGIELVVPAMPAGPWIVRPLYMRRNGTHVRLAPGATIQARRAAPGKNDFYRGYNDCLLRIMRFLDDDEPPMNSFDKRRVYTTVPLSNVSLRGGAGSALRMWKADYMDRSRYNFTEHRHAISAASVSGVLIEGLRIESSGGDGIDLSTSVRDITIRSVVSSDNYRQGMSVISAENMLVEDTVFERTRGTPPESGVDFEPDYGGDRLSNITFVNVSSVENHGSGFSIWVKNLQENHLPISITMRNCSNLRDHGSGINIGSVANPGLLEFDGHTIDSCSGGVYLNTKPQDQARVVMRNSLIKNISTTVHSAFVEADYDPLPLAPILFGCLDNRTRCGGVELDNVTVDDSACHNPRDFLAVGFKGRPKYGSVWTGTSWSHYLTGLGVVDLSGDVTVKTAVPCCPSSIPQLVANGSDTRLCRSKPSTKDPKECCLTDGSAGCPPLGPKRPMTMCKHVPNFNRGGECDAAHACSATYGPDAENVRLNVRCNPKDGAQQPAVANTLLKSDDSSLARVESTASPSLINLFPRGEHNIDCYFQPEMIAIPNTTVLVAIAEARMFSCNDGGPKRIAMRRSQDSGVTWEPTQWIYNDTALEPLPKAQRWAKWNQMGGANFTGSNLGSLFWNEHSNTLSLYFTFCTYGDQRAQHMQMLIMDSTTQGRSWGAPQSIAESVRADGKVLAFFGMVSGVQLRSKAHAGRIVLPGWALLNQTGVTGKYDVSGTAMMYSDDDGRSWQVSKVLTKNHPIADTQPSESTLVELSNGSLLVNIRDSLNIVEDKSHPERCGCRLLARSDDGGATYAAVWEDAALVSGSCAGAMLRSSANGRIFFVNPHSRDARVNGTVMVSASDGSPGSWELGGRVPGQDWVAAAGRPHDTFNFGYSAMALLPSDGGGQALGVAYQNGWIGNEATHFAFYCNDPCCGPDAAHPETAMCGVLFARMSVAG